MLLGPHADMAAEGQCEHSGTVPVQIVLLVAGAWCCAVDIEVCLHYADTKEIGSGLSGREVIQANIKFIRCFKAPGKGRFQAACGLSHGR